MYACEGFPPMAQLARRIVAAQRGAAKQRVIVLAKRSDELTCAPSRCHCQGRQPAYPGQDLQGTSWAALMRP